MIYLYICETPASSESPQILLVRERLFEALETKNESSIENPVQNQPGTAEKLNPLEGEPVRVNSEIEQEVALPPIYKKPKPQTEVAKPVSQIISIKRKQVHHHVALETLTFTKETYASLSKNEAGTSG